jgi:trans-aconitate 2-methyltransferase
MPLLEWDAATYDALPLPHREWGAGVLRRLAPRDGETVVDLGCGTGRDTERVLDALPRARVVAVDGSVRMLEQLRDRLGPRLPRVDVVQADLTAPFPPEVSGDAVMSVATFHWIPIPQQAALFDRIAVVLPPGGRFEAEYGGDGNLAMFQAAFTRAGGEPGVDQPWRFAEAGETEAALLRAGFTDVEVRLVPSPTSLQRGDQLEAFIATILIAATLRDLPEHEARTLVRRTAAELEEPVVDYVRLQVSATRG